MLEFLYLLIAFLLGLVLKDFLPSYVRKKAENLATKEDIADITHQVENVRAQYLQKFEEISHQNKKILEHANWKHQLRMTALEKRLATHQEAYSLWRNLLPNIYKEDKITETVLQCQEWWNNHCLYLEPEAREAFNTAYSSASVHKEIRDSRDILETKRNWAEIIKAGEALVKCVELPTINSLETNVPLPEN